MNKEITDSTVSPPTNKQNDALSVLLILCWLLEDATANLQDVHYKLPPLAFPARVGSSTLGPTVSGLLPKRSNQVCRTPQHRPSRLLHQRAQKLWFMNILRRVPFVSDSKALSALSVPIDFSFPTESAQRFRTNVKLMRNQEDVFSVFRVII